MIGGHVHFSLGHVHSDLDMSQTEMDMSPNAKTAESIFMNDSAVSVILDYNAVASSFSCSLPICNTLAMTLGIFVSFL